MLKRSRMDDDDLGAGPGPAGGGVMVVNRDPDSCELLARLLEHAGYQATRVFDPDTVVDQLTEGGVDAVVVDTKGAGSAFAVLDAVRRAEAGVADTAVIVLAETDADRLPVYQAGGDGYVVRPFHADELIEAVRATLRRSPEDRVAHRNSHLMGGAATS